MVQQVTGVLGVEKVTIRSNTHDVMTTCILCYALKAGESQSASFQSNNSLTGGSFDLKLMLLLEATLTVCCLQLKKEEPVGAVRR